MMEYLFALALLPLITARTAVSAHDDDVIP